MLQEDRPETYTHPPRRPEVPGLPTPLHRKTADFADFERLEARLADRLWRTRDL